MMQHLSAEAVNAIHGNGHIMQMELYDWYHSATDGHIRKPTGNPDAELLRSYEAASAIRQLAQRGWKLTSTADNSTGDLAGIDFIWSSPSGAWFPLDSKPEMKQTACPLVHRATVRNARGPAEHNKLEFDCKVGFLELLVRLSGQTPPFNRNSPPPRHRRISGRELFDDLAAFQMRLNALGDSTGDSSYTIWAGHLRKVIGYVIATQQRKMDPQMAAATSQRVRAAITGAVRSYLSAATVNPAAQASTKRTEFLRYDLASDILRVPVNGEDTLRLKGVAATVRATFASQYEELVSSNGAAQRLLQRKRAFETNGVLVCIASVLDELSYDYRRPARRA